MSRIYGFKSKAKAQRLSDLAHKLETGETVEYPTPGRMLELYKFTLTTLKTAAIDSTATADIQLAGSDGSDSKSDTVTDELGIFGTLAIDTIGYCYRQMGKYLIIQVQCGD